jgi:hypothetical protein
MAEVTIGISDDYAVLDNEQYKFYYGYEETANDEWCFTARDARDNGELCRYTTSYLLKNAPKLKDYDESETFIFLSVGMLLFFKRRDD